MMEASKLSYPIGVDRNNKPCYSPLYKEHKNILIPSLTYIKSIIKNDFLFLKDVHRRLSRVAIKYALGIDQQLREITPNDLERILRLIVLCDHHEMFDGKKIDEENLPEHVSPLLMGNAKEKRDFLVDLCKRVCSSEQLNDIDVSPVPWETLFRDQQTMLESAKNAVPAVPPDSPSGKSFIRKACALIGSCILGRTGRVEKLTRGHFIHILASIIMLDYYGIIRKGLQWDVFIKNVQPLFQSAEGMHAFLLDFAQRHFAEEYKKLKIILDKVDQMVREGKSIDANSYPVMKDRAI